MNHIKPDNTSNATNMLYIVKFYVCLALECQLKARDFSDYLVALNIVQLNYKQFSCIYFQLFIKDILIRRKRRVEIN